MAENQAFKKRNKGPPIPPGARQISGSSTFVMGKGKCRGATLDFSQTRQCLVSRQMNLCVPKGRRISPVPSGRFHFCHKYPAPCAGLISSVAPRPPKGPLKISPTINIEDRIARPFPAICRRRRSESWTVQPGPARVRAEIGPCKA